MNDSILEIFNKYVTEDEKMRINQFFNLNKISEIAKENDVREEDVLCSIVGQIVGTVIERDMDTKGC